MWVEALQKVGLYAPVAAQGLLEETAGHALMNQFRRSNPVWTRGFLHVAIHNFTSGLTSIDQSCLPVED